MRYWELLAAILVCSLGEVYAIFEDQVGNVDWRKDVLGPVTELEGLRTDQTPSGQGLFLYSSNSNDIALLDKKDGSIMWHRVASFDNDIDTVSIQSINRKNALSFMGDGSRGLLDILLIAQEESSINIVGLDSSDGAIIWQEAIGKTEKIIGFEYVRTRKSGFLVIVEAGSVKIFNCKTQDIVITRQYSIRDAAVFGSDLYLHTGSSVVKLNLNDYREETIPNDFEASFIVGDLENVNLLGLSGGKLILQDLTTSSKTSLGKISFGESFGLATVVRKTSTSLLATQYLRLSPEILLEVSSNKVSELSISSSSKLYIDSGSLGIFIVEGSRVLFQEKGTTARETHSFEEDISSLWNLNGMLYINTDTNNFFAYGMKSKEIKFEIPTFLSQVIGHPHFIDNFGFSQEVETGSTNREVLRRLVSAFEGERLSTLDLSLLSLRLKDQVLFLLDIFASIYLSVQDFIFEVFSTNGRTIVDMYRGDIDVGQYSSAEKRNFGFLKRIVILSKSGKISCLSSDNGEVKSLLNIPTFEESDFVESFTLSVSLPQKIFFFLKKRLIQFNPHVNTLTELKVFDRDIIRVVKPRDDIDEFVIIFDDLSIELWTDDSHSEHLSISDFTRLYMLLPKEDDKILSGYHLENVQGGLEFVESFRMTIPRGNRLVNIFSQEFSLTNSVGRNIGKGKLLAKFLADHVSTVVSVNDDKSQTLVQLVNLHSGAIIKSFILESCVSSTIEWVSFENNVVVSCFSSETQRSELLSISLFFDFVFEKFDLNPTKSVSSIVDSLDENELLVESNSFFFPKRIKSMSVTRSKQGIAEKKLLLALYSGQIIAVDKRLLDPRRPETEKLSVEEKEEGLIPYFPIIPLNSKTVVNHRNNLIDTERIFTFTSNLESTGLLLSLGKSIYFTRIQPSAGFDLMPEEFNYALLVLMVLGLSIAVSFLNNAIKKKRLAEAWK